MIDFCQGRAWIELDRAALRHNVEQLQKRLPPGGALMPAVKANAYGHGAVLIAKELNTFGVAAFCVASVFEGIELRQNGVFGEILILGYTHPRYVPYLDQYRLTQTILDYSYALELNACGRTIHVHIKIDTGMHRLGERAENRKELQQIFAAALEQSRAFYQTVKRMKELGHPIPKVHVLASGGLLHCPDIGGDYARPGIALYGQMSTKEEWSRVKHGLQPVLSLKARITLVKNLHRGEGAGYGHQFKAERDTKIAVASIGYADGLPRSLSNNVGTALVRGHIAPIVGRICMDQTLLDITDIPAVMPGDIAVFIGTSGNQEITACDIAEQAGTISNEVLSRLGGRLERVLV